MGYGNNKLVVRRTQRILVLYRFYEFLTGNLITPRPPSPSPIYLFKRVRGYYFRLGSYYSFMFIAFVITLINFLILLHARTHALTPFKKKKKFFLKILLFSGCSYFCHLRFNKVYKKKDIEKIFTHSI